MFSKVMAFSENCRRLQTAATSIALIYTGIGLLFLLANILCLYILMGIPETSMENNFQYGQWYTETDSEAISVDGYQLISMLKRKLSLAKADVLTVLTITLLYFMLELFVARVLYNGVKKLHLSKLQLWCDIRLAVLLVNVLAVCANIYYWTEQRYYALLNTFLIVLGLLGLFIVKKLMAVSDEFKLQIQSPDSSRVDNSSKKVQEASKATHSVAVDTFVI